MQADMGGVQIDPYEKYAAKWTNITLVTPKQEINMDPAWDLLDTNYGYSVLLGDLWVIIGKWFKQKWRNPFRSAHALVCSQYVLDVLRDPRNSFPGLDQLPQDSVEPIDLFNALQ